MRKTPRLYLLYLLGQLKICAVSDKNPPHAYGN